MDWFNYLGLFIMIIILIPNLIYGMKNPNGFENKYRNRFMEVLEQTGRFGCFGLMIFNIPYTFFNFWFENGLLVYIIVNSILVIFYIFGWVYCWNKRKLLRAYLLSIIPSLIFIFSGIMLLNIPLIISSIAFAIAHITISLKNAYLKEGDFS